MPKLDGVDLLANVREMGDVLDGALTERLGNHRHVGDIAEFLFPRLTLNADHIARVRGHASNRDPQCDRGGPRGRQRQPAPARLAPRSREPEISSPQRVVSSSLAVALGSWQARGLASPES